MQWQRPLSALCAVALTATLLCAMALVLVPVPPGTARSTGARITLVAILEQYPQSAPAPALAPALEQGPASMAKTRSSTSLTLTVADFDEPQLAPPVIGPVRPLRRPVMMQGAPGGAHGGTVALGEGGAHTGRGQARGAAAAGPSGERNVYAAQVARWLEEHKHFPASLARRQRADATVLVSFRLSRSGHASEVTLLESSGSSLLDHLAVRQVRDASPFPPPPPDIGLDALRFEVPMRYRVTS